MSIPLLGLVGVTGLLGVPLSSFGCAKQEKDASFFKPQDFEAPDAGETTTLKEFDKDNITETAALVDDTAMDVKAIQRFFHRTPYGVATFLETYQSNGVRASEAIARAATQYHINPLTFLVAAQGTQGLIGETTYPFPPERVEYVFRCGCLQGTNCEAALAGFDRQVDCLGAQLRAALDQSTGPDKQTASGWGEGITRTTLDNEEVTPKNAGTAVVYDRSPKVAEGAAGGTWLFWNLLRTYSAAANYSGPIGGTAGGGWIGDKCSSEASCGEPDPVCATAFNGVKIEGGLCTARCTGICPQPPGKPESLCIAFGGAGYCLPYCNLSAPICRAGWSCGSPKGFGTEVGTGKGVCQPPKK